MNAQIEEAPEFEGERCHYHKAIGDPDNTTGSGFRETYERYQRGELKLISDQTLKCMECFFSGKGNRSDAVRVDCWAYSAHVSEDRVVRHKDYGFVLNSELAELRRKENVRLEEVRRKKQLLGELECLRSLRDCGRGTESGADRIREIEGMIGDQ